MTFQSEKASLCQQVRAPRLEDALWGRTFCGVRVPRGRFTKGTLTPLTREITRLLAPFEILGHMQCLVAEQKLRLCCLLEVVHLYNLALSSFSLKSETRFRFGRHLSSAADTRFWRSLVVISLSQTVVLRNESGDRLQLDQSRTNKLCVTKHTELLFSDFVARIWSFHQTGS